MSSVTFAVNKGVSEGPNLAAGHPSSFGSFCRCPCFHSQRAVMPGTAVPPHKQSSCRTAWLPEGWEPVLHAGTARSNRPNRLQPAQPSATQLASFNQHNHLTAIITTTAFNPLSAFTCGSCFLGSAFAKPFWPIHIRDSLNSSRGPWLTGRSLLLPLLPHGKS